MPAAPSHFDVAIVGGGVIGLSIAWQAQRKGLTVVVLERDTLGCGASRVAAGMLAPVTEVEFGDAARESLRLGLHSVSMWPGFAASLQAASGRPVPLHRSGTLVVARDADEARELDRQIELRISLELDANRLRGSEARELEPALAPSVRLAMEIPDDHSVDPRTVIDALRTACEREGVELRERVVVQSVESRFGEVHGVALAGGETVSVPRAVIAAGAWSSQIDGLPESERLPVRPVKGQVLRLRDPSGPGLLGRVLRYEGGYVVPRGDGRYVLGASVEEKGFDRSPTAGAVRELLRDAWELLPGIDELAIEELAVGFRPGTPDNVPLIGQTSVRGLLRATGHYRNGILLAPLTGEIVARELAGETASSGASDDADGTTRDADGTTAGDGTGRAAT